MKGEEFNIRCSDLKTIKFIKKHSYVILLFAVVGVISIYSSPMFVPLPDRDSGVFLYTARQILSGDVPYRDIWDHKGPILYFINVFGLIIEPDSPWGIWLVESILLLIASAFSYKFSKDLFGKDVAFLSTLFWITFFTVIRKTNLAENYYIIIQILIIWLFHKSEKDENRSRIFFGIGALAATGFMLRPNLVGMPLAIGLVWLGQLAFDKKGKAFFKKTIFSFSGALTIFGIVSIYLIVNNAFYDFIDQVFRYNFSYINLQQVSFTSYLDFVNRNLPFIVPIAIIGWILLLLDLISEPGKNSHSNKLVKILVLICFPVEIYLSSLSGRNYTHYLVTWLVPMGFLAGYLFSMMNLHFPSKVIRKTKISMNLALIFIMNLALISFILMMNLSEIIISTSYFIREKSVYIAEPTYETDEIFDYVNHNSSSNDFILFWGNELTYNFLTNRRAPSRYSNIHAFTTEDYFDDDILNEFLDDIKSSKPLIIDTSPTNGNTPALFGSAVEKAKIEMIKEFIQDNYLQKDILQSNGWIVYEFNGN